MRNFARINNYYNRIEAVNDWNKLAAEILKTEHWRLVWKWKPADNAGWRKIDKAIAGLRKEYQAVEHLMQPTPSTQSDSASSRNVNSEINPPAVSG